MTKIFTIILSRLTSYVVAISMFQESIWFKIVLKTVKQFYLGQYLIQLLRIWVDRELIARKGKFTLSRAPEYPLCLGFNTCSRNAVDWFLALATNLTNIYFQRCCFRNKWLWLFYINSVRILAGKFRGTCKYCNKKKKKNDEVKKWKQTFADLSRATISFLTTSFLVPCDWATNSSQNGKRPYRVGRVMKLQRICLIYKSGESRRLGPNWVW